MAQPVYNNISVVQPTATTGVLGWLGWMLLISVLPLLGLIIMLLAANDPSAKNFAKAQLLLILIVCIGTLLVVGGLILLGVIGAAGASASY